MQPKMFIVIILILLINSRLLFGQDPLVEGLFDPSLSIRRETILTIIDQKLEEYVPYIEQAIFLQTEPFMIYTYLKALDILHSQNIVDFTFEFITRADDFDDVEPAEDPLEMKVKATIFLFNADNYSTSNYVFEIISRDRPTVNPYALTLLGRIMAEVPDYYEQAKSELLYIMNNAPDEISRFNAMFYLNEFSGTDVISEFVDKFINDPDMTVRSQALDHLFNLNYLELKSLLIQRLVQDPSEIMRAKIADSLLVVYGEPSDLKTVIDYQRGETDPDVKTWIQFAINDFIPPKPDTLNWSGMITKLISYVSEMYSYQWIANTQTRDYYVLTLNLLKRQIETRKYKDACSTINIKLLAKIEQDLQNNKITTEGYKFLHYYCLYIKEDFTHTLYPCP